MDERAPQRKSDVRAAVRARRRARSSAERAAAGRGIARTALELLDELAGRDRVVAAYASTPTEPGTAPLRAALAARGTTVLLPVVVPGDGAPLAWVVDGSDAAGGGAGGDAGGRAGGGAPRTVGDAGVVLLPALAVTVTGHRLGQGGGHYDRTLAELATLPAPGRSGADGGDARPLPLLVAVVHDDEVLEDGAWPVEAHDVRVDAVLTPTRRQALP